MRVFVNEFQLQNSQAMPNLLKEQKGVYEYSFEDAQRDSSLLNPDEEELSDALKVKASLYDTQMGESSSISQSDINTRTDIGLEPSVVKGNQISIIDGQLEEDIAIREAEEARIQQEIQREIEKEALKEEKRREKEAASLPIKLAREAEEKKLAIERAIENRRIIERQANRLDRESTLCTKWNAGRSGVEAIGRQLIGLWQVSFLFFSNFIILSLAVLT